MHYLISYIYSTLKIGKGKDGNLARSSGNLSRWLYIRHRPISLRARAVPSVVTVHAWIGTSIGSEFPFGFKFSIYCMIISVLYVALYMHVYWSRDCSSLTDFACCLRGVSGAQLFRTAVVVSGSELNRTRNRRHANTRTKAGGNHGKNPFCQECIFSISLSFEVRLWITPPEQGQCRWQFIRFIELYLIINMTICNIGRRDIGPAEVLPLS